MLILGCTGKLMFIGGTMKFLKINAKVLLILCLFSGILFLSTGCGENKENESNLDGSEISNSTDKETENDKTPETSQNSNEGICMLHIGLPLRLLSTGPKAPSSDLEGVQ